MSDLSRWGPLAQTILARHGLQPAAPLRMADAATFPVVIAAERWAVKLFPESPYAAVSAAAERDALALARRARDLPGPRLIAAGELSGNEAGWPWPYLVTSVVPGVSLGSILETVAPSDLEETARWLGAGLQAFHHVDFADAVGLVPTWDDFAARLSAQRSACVEAHRQWGLAPRLLAEIDGYVPQAEALVDRSRRPLLLHGDLHAWHILGSYDAGRFEPRGVIDFGDAHVGDLLYELVPLHLKTFRGDKRLLRAFLDGYGLRLALDDDFARRAMCFTLLFEYGTLEWIDASSARSLDDLAAQLWNEQRDVTVAIRAPQRTCVGPGAWSIAT